MKFGKTFLLIWGVQLFVLNPIFIDTIFSKTYPSLQSYRQELMQLISDVEMSAVAVHAKIDMQQGESRNADSPTVDWTNFGAGLIIDKQHIITKQKVTKASIDIIIATQDGRKVNAQIVGADDALGISLLKIEGEFDQNFLPEIMDTSKMIRAGEPVIILSNSLGVMPAVSMGTINCIRNDGMIQLSVDLPAGSAGGAVFNFDGQLVGLVAMEIDLFPDELPYSADFLSTETLLVHPIQNVLNHTQLIVQNAGKKEGFVGLVVEDWPSHLGGAHVKRVYNDSPADRSGIQVGDIILASNNHKVATAYDLFQNMQNYQPGDSVTLNVLRSDQIHSIPVRVAPPPESSRQDVNQSAQISQSQQSNTPQTQITNDFLLMRIKNLERELQVLRELLQKE